MKYYLIRSGQAAWSSTVDPYSPRLTPEGHAQAARVAERCRAWGLQFLAASTMRRAQETADAVTLALPGVDRWDLVELEDLTLEDLNYDPTAGHLAAKWTESQKDYGFERAWVRVMAAMARIEIYATARQYDRIGIVAHGSTLSLLILNWLGLDWRSRRHLMLELDHGSTTHVEIAPDGAIAFGWINRI